MTENDHAHGVDGLIQAVGDSLFAPETLEDIRCRLSFIAASECNCIEGPHENALHDLAHDDVPVLLQVIERLDGRLQKLRELCDANSFGSLGDAHPWAAIRTADVRAIVGIDAAAAVSGESEPK